ncbi:MAG: amidohydrolase family protein [Clostridium sp.]|uniref:amidohydrolase family protein n=1 Tax=Clostridium sp. TaxID=1506 RepID=UPI003D6CE57F
MKKGSSNILVLKGINLIDGLTDKIKVDVTIIVQDGIITDIGKESEVFIPQQAEVLYLSGKTVLPGLIDSHLHLSQSGVDDFVKPYAERMNTKLIRNAYLTLKSGVTTIRNMPGGSGNCVLKFGEKVKQGKVIGPRILASGPALVPSYGYFSLKRFFPSNPIIMFILSRGFGAHGLSIDVDSQKEAKEAVKKLKKYGVDFIKTVTPGAYIPFIEKDKEFKDELLKNGLKLEMIEASMKPEVLRTIVEEAHREGLKIAAHTISWPEDLKEAVKAGVDSIEHTPLGLMDDETFELMKSKSIYWVPTAYCFYNWSDFIDNPEQYNSEEIKEAIPEPFYTVGKKSLDKAREGIKSGKDSILSRFYAEIKPFKEKYFPINFRHALDKGIKIVAAVDAGASGASCVPHGQLHKELEIFVKHGMSEFEAILTATKNAAELLGLEKELGTIEVGKIGDFVVLNANPLSNISNIKSINCVIKEGTVVYNKIQ